MWWQHGTERKRKNEKKKKKGFSIILFLVCRHGVKSTGIISQSMKSSNPHPSHRAKRLYIYIYINRELRCHNLSRMPWPLIDTVRNNIIVIRCAPTSLSLYEVPLRVLRTKIGAKKRMKRTAAPPLPPPTKRFRVTYVTLYLCSSVLLLLLFIVVVGVSHVEFSPAKGLNKTDSDDDPIKRLERCRCSQTFYGTTRFIGNILNFCHPSRILSTMTRIIIAYCYAEQKLSVQMYSPKIRPITQKRVATAHSLGTSGS